MYNHTASHPHSRGLPWRALREREEEEREREEGGGEGGRERRNREGGERGRGGRGKERRGRERKNREGGERGRGGRGKESRGRERKEEERECIYILQQKSHTTLVYTYTVLMNGSRVKACGVMAISLLLSIFL